MTQQPRPAPDEPGAGLDVSERAGKDTLYALDAAVVTNSADALTLAQAVEGFLLHCTYEKNLSPRTIHAYRLDLRQFSAHLCSLDSQVVQEIGKEVIRGFIQALYQRFSEKSVKRKVATLKALFAHLEREEAILSSPFRKMEIRIREKKRLPRTLSLRELEALVEAVYSRRISRGRKSPSGVLVMRDIAVLELLFATGARVSEVCGLVGAGVDLDGGVVRILGKGRRERMVSVSNPEVLAALRAYSNASPPPTPSDYFFRTLRGGRLSEQSVRQMLLRHGNAAGIAGRVTPHLIRHSVATLLLEEGVDIRYIQHLLGHSSISTTQIYTHVSAAHQRSLLAAHHPRRHFTVPGGSCPK